MKLPDAYVGKRFFVGEGKPEILGRGPTEVRGSAYIEGPEIVGDPNKFATPNKFELGGLMASQCENDEMKPKPFYAFIAKTYARIMDFLKVDKLLTTENIKCKIIYAEVIMAKVKNFSIPHPTKKNKNLVYACLEGPENAVYVRGRLKHKDIIILPSEWRKLIDPKSITVSLTPIGAHQDIIVKGIQDYKIVIQAKPGFPIDCYYHVFAERKDVDKLVTEIPSDASL